MVIVSNLWASDSDLTLHIIFLIIIWHLVSSPHHHSLILSYHWIFGLSLGLFRASLVAQMIKNLPARQETRVQFLDQEDPLEKKMAIPSSILAWRIP